MRSVAEDKGDCDARAERRPMARLCEEGALGIRESASEWNSAGDRALWFGGVRDGDWCARRRYARAIPEVSL
jgi:hypothetical protein